MSILGCHRYRKPDRPRPELSLSDPCRSGTTHVMPCRSTGVLGGCHTVTKGYIQPVWCFHHSEHGMSWRAPFLRAAVGTSGISYLPGIFCWPGHAKATDEYSRTSNAIQTTFCNVKGGHVWGKQNNENNLNLKGMHQSILHEEMNPRWVEVSSLGIRHMMSTENLTMFKAVKAISESFCTWSDKEYKGLVLFFFS